MLCTRLAFKWWAPQITICLHFLWKTEWAYQQLPKVFQDWQPHINSRSSAHSHQVWELKSSLCYAPEPAMFWETGGLQLRNYWGTSSFEQDFPRVPGKKRRPERVLSQTLINQMREVSPLVTHLFFFSFDNANDFSRKSITDSRGKLEP